MPSKSLSTAFLSSALTGTSSICPTCALSTALRLQIRSRPLSSRPSRRRASNLASSTAINAVKEIPPNLKPLYQSLELLRKDAQNYINTSRLQLALRSLESSQPVTRIAILGLRSTGAAKKLARLLLADVLSDAGPWEKQLEQLEAQDQRGLLIRYGEDSNGPVSDSLVTTLYVPSRILANHNLEILVSSLNLSAGLASGPIDTAELRRTALVPTAEAQRSFSGQVEYIRYPVHKAIVLAEGLQGCLALGPYAMLNSGADSVRTSPLQLALDIPLLDRSSASSEVELGGIATLDLDSGSLAIDKFRESNQNGMVYEKNWHKSGITQLSEWINAGAHTTPIGSVTSLIQDTLAETTHHIDLEIEARNQQLNLLKATDVDRQPMQEALKVWAMRAHSELRDELDGAFASRVWDKLAWWKLFWRTDDVTMILSEMLQRSWLVDAEKGLIWLSGRSVEAGFDFGSEASHLRLREPLVAAEQKVNVDDSMADTGVVVKADYPWPSTIPTARLGLQLSTIPALQALSQDLLLRTYSIAGLSASLSALVYVSLSTATVYSSGAIAALGLVWSLRFMQKRWERARRTWESDVREAARVVLRDAEEKFRAMIEQRPKVEDDLNAGDRERAMAAVRRASEELRKVAGR